ncbi:MAG: DNA alkylation repair protein [Spirochaetes bacterium]|nr:DNA alkylation repair protein [Spirochaetota bacterium]
MSRDEVLAFLEEHGSETAKKTLVKHGAREPFFGTRIGDMKPLVKKIKWDHELALELYETGNSDAMYFAGLIADETKVTKEQLQHWVQQAYWYMLSECTVAWLAAESPYGFELAREWMAADEEMIACAGWSTFASLLQIRSNDDFDPSELEQLLDTVEETIHEERNRVRYVMNQFVISVGSAVPALTERCKQIGERVGTVRVDMGETACTVPLIKPYIEKIESRGKIGKKRAAARC